MRKFRYWWAVTNLFIRRFRIAITLGLVFGLLVFITREQIFSLPIFLQNEKYGLVGRYTSENLPLSILEELSIGLTKLNSEKAPEPGIAQSWEAKDEGKAWVFKLKNSHKWQNGQTVVSSDIKYNFPDVSVSYPSRDQIEFRLPDPYAPFPVLVSRPLFKQKLLGASDTRIERITLDGQYVKELVLEERKTKKRKLYRLYPTEQSLRTAFKLGEIDNIKDISTPAELSNFDNARVSEKIELERFIAIFFNTSDSAFQDKTLRQALAYAIKKPEEQERALGPISPVSWAYNSLVKRYDYDTNRAKQLVNQIPKEERPKRISLVTIPSLLPLAEDIARDWRELGFEVIVQVSATVPDNFQTLLATQSIPPDPDQYALWHSTQHEGNITRYNNPRIDKLLEDGRRTLDQNERKRIYLDFQRFLVEDAPVIFLYHPKSYSVERK